MDAPRTHTYPFPRFETDRLIVRMLEPNDAEAVTRYQVENRVHLAYSRPDRGDESYTLSYWQKMVDIFKAEFHADKSLRLYVFLKSDPSRIVGAISYTNFRRGPLQACNLGYGLARDVVGQGYMVEALKPTVDYIFSKLAIHRIEASYWEPNVKSGKVLERLGFSTLGRAPSYLHIQNEWQDHVLTALVSPQD